MEGLSEKYEYIQNVWNGFTRNKTNLHLKMEGKKGKKKIVQTCTENESYVFKCDQNYEPQSLDHNTKIIHL
jgi:hypothetical protein